ncbi:hypothetical protein [Nitrococcus mobilis]|uniref:Uncharacterized protein n=1 Tax=Nitrococcus mobilis Nb-231 TaxID=314278 RepID=A4BLA2_9GAMM|nr:hypothetical protein [Nitrococcus mobilis]EAR23090.1 hypothetical protein NB231_14758 [Nitrococcus mobilis Nb-231]
MPGNPEVEYTETLASHRHYSNLRFTSLGVFAVLFVGLVAAATGAGGALPDATGLRGYFIFLSLVLSLVFWAFEEGIDGYLRALGQRIIELETALQYARFSSRPHWANQLATPATRAPYLLNVLLSIAFLSQ